MKRKILSTLMVAMILIGGTFMRSPFININPEVSNLLRVDTESNFKDILSRLSASNLFNMEVQAMPSLKDNDAGVSKPKEFIGTNEQVAGVSEGDIVKTDGNFIFYAPTFGNNIEILTVGDNKTISKRETLKTDIRTENMYITPTQIVVIGYAYEEATDGILRWWGGAYWYDQSGSVRIYNRQTLKQEYALNTNSTILHHRMVGDKLYFVSNKSINTESEKDDVRPYIEEKTTMSSDKRYFEYKDIYYFEEVMFSTMSVFITVDTKSFESSGSVFLVNADQVYMNTRSLYTIGNYYNYNNNVSWITDTKLMVMKFDIGDELVFRASSLLTGTIVNQFSMDEHEDKFRIALTNSVWTPNRELEVSNNIYILEEDPDTEILITSAVSPHLGEPGETIKSVRFSGNIARVVTFLQTDPLYTIDLADNFKIISEIKETGFSTYMHDWGNEFVVGLGYAADETGRITGMKISAYRTDMGATEPIQTITFDNESFPGWTWAYSEALHNHKAMMVSPEKNLFGFPVSSTKILKVEGVGEQWSHESYYVLFSINFTNLPMPIQMISTMGHGESEENYNIERGIYIDGVVYTISAKQVMSYDIDTGEIQIPVTFLKTKE
jgi:inhibitor of cysteine peptidase